MSTVERQRGSKQKSRKGTGAQQVYSRLRELIITFGLEPGDGLEEAQLVQRFGVSRTPVREALIRLAAEGLAVLLPNRRAKVAPMNLVDIRDHLEALDLLQPAICSWAAIRRSPHDVAEIDKHRLAFEAAATRHDSDGMIEANFGFHASTGEAAGNGSVMRAFRRVLTDQLRIAHMAMTDHYFGTENAYSGHIDRIVHEHREIAGFIADGDAKKAEEAGRRHADLGRIRISDYLSVTLAKTLHTPSVQVMPAGDWREMLPSGARSSALRGRKRVVR